MNKNLILNYLVIIGIIFIFFAGILIIAFYFYDQKEECTSSPFVYGVNQLEEKFGVTIHGTMVFINHPGFLITFDNTNFYIDRLETNQGSKMFSKTNLTELLENLEKYLNTTE